jgi:hypothetical protein
VDEVSVSLLAKKQSKREKSLLKAEKRRLNETKAKVSLLPHLKKNSKILCILYFNSHFIFR